MFSVGWQVDLLFSWLHRHSQTKAGDKLEHAHREQNENVCVPLGCGRNREDKPSHEKKMKKNGNEHPGGKKIFKGFIYME